ncbi:hypothetical protein A3C26_00255 [Candidatus Daviesbacteria bacterium RIFCSPHIGHO2_02_FULL_39_12]|uniref:Uncharacterized protein n=1 Tax=Candidatus Daviesbacteria bacterium RIFCSPHIGHO2_02_FULL_39_12 TaxID=1797770 RepID=A0A1F5J8F2_9BACT|nr:MAG: hypothetical protein A3C26_00255 [Candidatus Daviesbacteria bacterium RIFCSPHIGHO2_02_FULL_39_12]
MYESTAERYKPPASLIDCDLAWFAWDSAVRILQEGSNPFTNTLGETQEAYRQARRLARCHRGRNCFHPWHINPLLSTLGYGSDSEIRFNEKGFCFIFAEHPLPSPNLL